ncbi:MAG: FAD binding domain-containing protein [Treponema sp.]|jgi:CO/xanthine dehydrogenase FAD-binding subunit|nr:FAD binding domain-containing protein [Treponema sp.]
MAVPLNQQVFFPENFQELFSAWTRYPQAVPYAGGTGLVRRQGRQALELPPIILSLEKLSELQRVTRTEQYLEIGAMVRLNEIFRLGKIVPDALSLCLESIGNPPLRNIATMGGNICYPARKLDLSAPMIALDAHYELRNSQNARWISATRFSSPPGPPAINGQELLARIRIPLDHWNYTVYRKFKAPHAGEPAGVIVFIMKNRKNILTDIRIVYTAETILRDKNSEASLIGKELPLNRRDARNFTEQWRAFLAAQESPAPLTRAELLNFIESNIFFIAD